jgi:hypothetical protein
MEPMQQKFESVLEDLLDYYGNFAQENPIAAMIQAAGEWAGLARQVRPLSDDCLADIAAAGDTPPAQGLVFPGQGE